MLFGKKKLEIPKEVRFVFEVNIKSNDSTPTPTSTPTQSTLEDKIALRKAEISKQIRETLDRRGEEIRRLREMYHQRYLEADRKNLKEANYYKVKVETIDEILGGKNG